MKSYASRRRKNKFDPVIELTLRPTGKLSAHAIRAWHGQSFFGLYRNWFPKAQLLILYSLYCAYSVRTPSMCRMWTCKSECNSYTVCNIYSPQFILCDPVHRSGSLKNVSTMQLISDQVRSYEPLTFYRKKWGIQVWFDFITVQSL